MSQPTQCAHIGAEPAVDAAVAEPRAGRVMSAGLHPASGSARISARCRTVRRPTAGCAASNGGPLRWMAAPAAECPGVESQARLVAREPHRPRCREGRRSAAVRDSDRGAVSPSADRHESPLAIGGEGEAGPVAFARQVRDVSDQILFGHSARQVVEHVGHRHAQVTDAGVPPRRPGSIVILSTCGMKPCLRAHRASAKRSRAEQEPRSA